MELTEYKDYLVEKIEGQADWREQKAAEYPEDGRNGRSAKALRVLASRLKELPATYPKLRELWRLWYGLRKPRDPNPLKEPWPFIEVEIESIRVYGFYNEANGDPEEFLTEWIQDLKSELSIQRKA